MTTVLAWLRQFLHRRDEHELPPQSPDGFTRLSDDEREQLRRTIVEREQTLRMLEAKARVKSKRPW